MQNTVSDPSETNGFRADTIESEMATLEREIGALPLSCFTAGQFQRFLSLAQSREHFPHSPEVQVKHLQELRALRAALMGRRGKNPAD